MQAVYLRRQNDPIKYIDIDGNVIGNPDDPKVKQVKALLETTANGKDLWKRMNASPRTIFIMFGSDESENEMSNKIGRYLTIGRLGRQVRLCLEELLKRMFWDKKIQTMKI